MRSKILIGAMVFAAGAAGVGLGLAAWTSSAAAQSAPSVRTVARPASYSVALEGEQGERLRTFQHSGRTFALGRLGERYDIRVSNWSDERVEAVITVDGRDAVSGQLGDLRGRGYLIGPHDSVLVQGFRQSLEQVAAFRFAHPAQSYSARMGTPENVGVIGVAFFPERRRPVVVLPPPRMRAPSAGTRPKASARAASPPPEPSEEYRLGTEYGESRWSRVQQVPFERANPSRPARTIVVYYDDAQGLEGRGIRVFGDDWWRPRPMTPDPFPAQRPTEQFAPPPP